MASLACGVAILAVYLVRTMVFTYYTVHQLFQLITLGPEILPQYRQVRLLFIYFLYTFSRSHTVYCTLSQKNFH
jgi:hypothetical protein